MDMMKRRNHSYRETIYLGQIAETKTKWKFVKFWKKFSRGKERVSRVSYDPDDYCKNFDEGSGLTEPDNLQRSFSARYSNPSSSSSSSSFLKNSSVRYVRGV